MTMTNNLRTETRVGALEENQSAVSWAAIAAGGVATAALTLLLLAFGAGMGFSAISPWSNAGISSETFSLAAGIYLIVVAMLASTIGGYVAGRLRTKWVGVHSDEVAFRDTAHGILAWAFAAACSGLLRPTWSAAPRRAPPKASAKARSPRNPRAEQTNISSICCYVPIRPVKALPPRKALVM